jgi:hypothetical protein
MPGYNIELFMGVAIVCFVVVAVCEIIKVARK